MSMVAERTPDATPRMLEVVSEPVRWRAYQLLRGLGPMRAEELAQRAAVTTASMLRHLRLLRSVGMVDIDPASSSAERYATWIGVPGGIRLDTPIGNAEFTDEDLRRWSETFFMVQSFFLNEWAQTESNWPAHVRNTAVSWDYWLHLTEDETLEFSGELEKLLKDWHDRSVQRINERGHRGDPSLSPWYTVISAVPVRQARSGE